MMEKQRDESKDEIRSNLPSPTLHPHRTSNFFIEDILRADFGCTRPSQTLPESNCSTDRGSSSACKRHSQADEAKKSSGETSSRKLLWPAWVYCTRYSDRPSSGPRTRKLKKKKNESEDKRPRTAFTAEQLQTLKNEFQKSPYITEQRRHILAHDLKLNESQIKIWFQNKRAKIKKSRVLKNDLALQLMEQGLYNHSTSKTP